LKKIKKKKASKGLLKFQKILNVYPLPVIKSIAMDIGAASGGFITQLFKSHMQKIYANDISPILIKKLNNHKKIDKLQKINLLNILYHYFHPRPQIITIDISFKSVQRILSKIRTIISSISIIYFLVKSQFEVDFILKYKEYKYICRMALINILYFTKVILLNSIIYFSVINNELKNISIEYWIITQS